LLAYRFVRIGAIWLLAIGRTETVGDQAESGYVQTFALSRDGVTEWQVQPR